MKGEFMTSVYIVQHLREDPDGFDDVKLIGAFSSRESAYFGTGNRRFQEPNQAFGS